MRKLFAGSVILLCVAPCAESASNEATADPLHATLRDLVWARLSRQKYRKKYQEAGPVQGTGIGLVITKRLAELMGGGVGFRSDPGQGSAFWVNIPVHHSRAKSAPERAFVERGAELSVGSERVVLYVEDNPANVVFMKDLLGTFDRLTLVTTATAEEGVATAAASARDRQQGEQAGFHRYLTKPVKVDELIAALEELFAGAQPS